MRSSRLLVILLILLPVFADLTIHEYQDLELETPELIFEPMESDFAQQLTPGMEKLIFVTPWNPRGNELVLKYAHKLDYVSPCWYDLSFSADHIIIENDKLYNQTFIKEVKAANPKIKILPRFYISSNQQALLHSIGSFQVKFKQAIGLIVTLIENQHFDGLVWDSPFNTMLASDKYMGIRNLIVQLVNSIRMNLYPDKLLFFNMANPMGLILAHQMYTILNVDCIMVQNYDNNNYLPMLQAALAWAKATKFNYKPKIMMLLPFFSRRGGQGIDTKELQKAYASGQRLGSKIEGDVCVFYQYERRMESFVPCYAYFRRAFQMIQREGFRVGFWEAGNGLENYYRFL